MAGYKAPKDAIRNLADKYKVRLNYEEATNLFSNFENFRSYKISPNGLVMVNEPGVYKLASGKNEKFENWIFFDVLTSIRKTGSYGVEQQQNRLINNLMTTTEQLLGIRREELAILQSESPQKKLSNLMIDCSKNGMGSLRELYDELFLVFASETGIEVEEIARTKQLERRVYVKQNPALAEMLFRFAHSHFNRLDRQVILVPLDVNQRTLEAFKC
jgi:prophage antirepressor-like protein